MKAAGEAGHPCSTPAVLASARARPSSVKKIEVGIRTNHCAMTVGSEGQDDVMLLHHHVFPSVMLFSLCLSFVLFFL